MGPEGMGPVYEVLGPGGPHQSICDGKTECVVDLIERYQPELMCKRSELEGANPK